MDLFPSRYRKPGLFSKRYLSLITMVGAILLMAVPPWVFGGIRWLLVLTVAIGSVSVVVAAIRLRR